MTTPSQMRDFYELVGAHCDSTLSEEQAAKLQALVLSDADLRQRFILCMHIHATAERSLSSLLPTADESSAFPAQSSPLPASLPVLGFLHSSLREARHVITQHYAAVAIIVLAAVVPLVFFGIRAFHGQVDGQNVAGRGEPDALASGFPAHPEADASGSPVARLVRTHECTWLPSPVLGRGAGGEGLVPGSLLPANQKLELRTGLAEITFNKGASIIVEGPATLELTSDNSAKLTAGKLTAAVPPSAVGFEVDTPTSQIVDLSTEFGVAVGAAGQTDVHVMVGHVKLVGVSTVSSEQGEPDASASGFSAHREAHTSGSSFKPVADKHPEANASGSPLILSANESAHIEKPQGNSPPNVTFGKADATHFVRSMDLIPHPAKIINASFEEPRLRPGEIWREGQSVGWDIGTDNGGIFRAADASMSDPCPDGQQIAFLNKGKFHQVLTETLAANSRYVLTYSVGHRRAELNGKPLKPDYAVEVSVDRWVLASQVNPAMPARGRFERATLVFATGSSPAGLGQPLWITFRSNGSLETGVQNLFDDVRLEVQPLGGLATAAISKPGDADYPAPSPSARHTEKVVAVKSGDYELVFIGDSITHSLGELNDGKYKPNKAVWEKHFAQRKAINLGMNGYRTENILWDLQNGELDFVKSPKVFVLLIGTNNSDDRHFPVVHTPEQILAGTRAIVDLIKQRHPTTKILILRIFPRGGDSEKSVSPPAFNSSAKCIETCRRAGELTKQLADNRQIFWLDINHIFLRPDGTINTELMWDLLHPSAPMGAEAWVQAIEPTLVQLLDENSVMIDGAASKNQRPVLGH